MSDGDQIHKPEKLRRAEKRKKKKRRRHRAYHCARARTRRIRRAQPVEVIARKLRARADGATPEQIIRLAHLIRDTRAHLAYVLPDGATLTPQRAGWAIRHLAEEIQDDA